MWAKCGCQPCATLYHKASVPQEAEAECAQRKDVELQLPTGRIRQDGDGDDAAGFDATLQAVEPSADNHEGSMLKSREHLESSKRLARARTSREREKDRKGKGEK